MALTAEQNAYILMAHFRSGTRNPDGTWSYSLQSCIEQFAEAFPDANILYETFAKHRSIIIKRFTDKHCICKGKPTGRPTVITEEFVDLLKENPNSSFSKQSAKAGVSETTCRKVVKKLPTHLYKAKPQTKNLRAKDIDNDIIIYTRKIIEQNTSTSIPKLPEKADVSVKTCHKIVKNLRRTHPYKVNPQIIKVQAEYVDMDTKKQDDHLKLKIKPQKNAAATVVNNIKNEALISKTTATLPNISEENDVTESNKSELMNNTNISGMLNRWRNIIKNS